VLLRLHAVLVRSDAAGAESRSDDESARYDYEHDFHDFPNYNYDFARDSAFG
jgi:hypothetical protein